MKPTKNRVFCKDCGRLKMLFETEKKAENFIKFNKEEIEIESGYGPQRSYFCLFCGGWHTTSIKEKIGISKNEQLLGQYEQEKEKKLTRQNQGAPKKNKAVENKENLENKIRELENQIEGMKASEKEFFISNSISKIKNEIDNLVSSDSSSGKQKLKELRQKLSIYYLLRKQNGITKANKKLEEAKEKEMEEWRLWAQKRGYE